MIEPNPTAKSVGKKLGVNASRVRYWWKTGQMWSYLPAGLVRGRRTTWAAVDEFIKNCGTDNVEE